eukprot:COSAG05_NODE_334_length_11233_cov_697.826477_11_plen_73_part_00
MASLAPRLSDFEVLRKLGDGSNAIVYLAKCRTEGQLRAHVDTMVVLKVLIHYKQQGSTSDLVSKFSSVPAHL